MIRDSLSVVFAVLQAAIGFVGPLPEPSTPSGLEIELRTVGGKAEFRLSEIVPLEIAFRATGALAYSLETADGWNHAPAQDRFLVDPGQEVISRNVWWMAGAIVCCDSKRNFLSSVPTIVNHELTDFLRFTQAGQYRVQYTTRRVFAGRQVRAYDPSALLVRSNVITIRIIPDDPEWLRAALPRALAGVDAAPPRREFYEQANRLPSSRLKPPPSTAMRRYQRALRELRLLDTPEAIRARVSRLKVPTIEEWRSGEAKGNGYSVETSTAYSSRPDLVEAAMRERAGMPDFGVTRGYFELWANVLAERDHPELVRLTNREGLLRPDQLAAWRSSREAAVKSLRELNRRKVGLAAEITATTIRFVQRDLDR